MDTQNSRTYPPLHEWPGNTRNHPIVGDAREQRLLLHTFPPSLFSYVNAFYIFPKKKITLSKTDMLSGGPADKAGNYYETLWTVRQLIRLFEGEVDSIRIEVPGEDKAEFVITRGSQLEFHQAKRQCPRGSGWTLKQLAGREFRILQYFGEKLGKSSKCIFTSSSDTKELRNLAERARSAETFEEFEECFLDADWTQTTTRTLQDAWGGCNLAEVYTRLQNLEIRVIDERTLRELIIDVCRAVFDAPPDRALAHLKLLADESLHKTLDRTAVRECLKRVKIEGREITEASELAPTIASITSSYTEPLRLHQIGGEPIPREEAITIVKRITTASAPVDTFLSGDAGSGKSGCLLQIIDRLSEQGVPVLAFRLDRIEPVPTTVSLGKSIGLPESPAVVLARAFPDMPAVLIIDQLDAVSTTSGRRSDFFSTIEALLSEVRGLRRSPKIHVILACREFDLNNDHRLKSALGKEHPPVKLGLFSENLVKQQLSERSFRPDDFSSAQLELLRLPQNLSLYLNSHSSDSGRPRFESAKDLFDSYWSHKREKVRLRAETEDHWIETIDLLSDRMSSTQQLSTPLVILDSVPLAYINGMASEGVLAKDDYRCGFGHESFFDYCFARTFVRRGDSLVNFLKNDQQHLFRRGQVRQILAYLRDADRQQYINQASEILSSPEVRGHIKQLALDFMCFRGQADDVEWEVLNPFIRSEMESIVAQEVNKSKIASMAWRHFCGSRYLFPVADRHGMLADWIHTDSEPLLDRAVFYLRTHADDQGERVAELLSEFQAAGEGWKNRLRSLMESVSFARSRGMLDLFLRLLDSGVLDDARDRFATNGTFWSMLHGLHDEKPEWVCEVASHWLQRQMQLQADDEEKARSSDIFNDDFGVELISTAATNAPKEFADEVLPTILKLAEANLYETDKSEQKLKVDSIWAFRHLGSHIGLSDAFLFGARDSLASLIQSNPELARPHLERLKSSEADTANWVLLSALGTSGPDFADESITLIVDESFRLRCGFSDSSYWVTSELIRAATPHCSNESLAALESLLLDYIPDFEKSANTRQLRGRAQFTLLAAIDESKRSAEISKRIAELERKLGKPDNAPRGIRAYSVGSPIEASKAEQMTDEQWLSAINTYNTPERKHDWEHPERGGAWELSRVLEASTKAEPERFGLLSAQFPDTAESSYFSAVLSGMTQGDADSELKLKVAMRVFDLPDKPCGKTLANVFGSIRDTTLPEDSARALAWLATEHPDPERDSWRPSEDDSTVYYGGDILTAGINTVRGTGAWAIRDLIFRDKAYITIFLESLAKLVEDRVLAVRACAAGAIYAIAYYDPDQAIPWFMKLIESEDALLGTSDVERYIRVSLTNHFEAMEPVIQRMLDSEVETTSQAGGRLAGLAALVHPREASSIAEKAISGSDKARLGAAEIARNNLGTTDDRNWCEQTLTLLFSDDAQSVRHEAATSFRTLEGTPPEEYEELIKHFINSPAFEADSFSLTHYLLETSYRVPAITIAVCERFLERFSDEAKDIATSRAVDSRNVSKLIYRTYAQHDDEKIQNRCLDLIDSMCVEGVYDALRDIEGFER